MRELVIDIETTVKNTVGGSKGNAFCPDNYTVLYGDKVVGEEKITILDHIDYSGADVYIGHNIKFDLHWIHREDKEYYNLIKTKKIWDTQIAEYMLTAQQSLYPALTDVSVKYAGTAKLDVVKAAWDQGVQTEDMDKNILTEYLEGDLRNTEIVYKAQRKRAKELGMEELIWAIMRSVQAVTDMEINGLAIDINRLASIETELKEEYGTLSAGLESYVFQSYREIPEELINLSSPLWLQAILFGGNVSYQLTIPDGFYKGGKKKGLPKTKKVEYEKTLTSLINYTPKEEWKNKKGYSTAEDILEEINLEIDHPFIKGLLRLRWLQKQLGTYCEGIRELVFPDGFIHHNLNQCATVTGRLSGSSPNMQNIPTGKDSDIKSYFISRYGDKGYILNVDYSQLEIIWQAFVTRDKRLIEDVINNVDFHVLRLALKERKSYEEVFDLTKVKQIPEWIEKRNSIKHEFSFKRAYGAGAKSIAEGIGFSIEEVKALIKAEEALYPQLTEFFNRVRSTARVRYKPDTHKSESGKSLGTGFYQCVTGRIYHFKEYESKWKDKIFTDFSMPQVRNYPIQGGATGDMVQIVMGRLNDLIFQYREAFDGQLHLINQVHDSMIFDVHEQHLDTACHFINKVLSNSPQILKETIGLDFDLPLKTDMSYGRNWKDQQPYKFIQ